MADVFEVLGHDHEEVKRMLAELESGPSVVTGADGPQLLARKKTVERLIITESRHEVVEEKYFWPAVREKLPFPQGIDLAGEATSQEQAAKFVLARLGQIPASDREFEKLLSKFITAARAHIAFEETSVWPLLWRALSTAESSRLAGKVSRARGSAPTRPHPHTPPLPSMLKATGPAVAAIDRLRDAITGRGRDLGRAGVTARQPAGLSPLVNRVTGARDSLGARAASTTPSDGKR